MLKTAIVIALSAAMASMLSFAPSAVRAAGFALKEQSAEGQGASFAGIAAGGADLSSMFFNPATIALHNGWQVEADASVIVPYSRAQDGSLSSMGPVVPPGVSDDSGNIGEVAFVAAFYSSAQINEMLFVGLMVNVPFGLSTEANSEWLGAPHGVSSSLETYNIGPTIGFKFSDALSVGVGLQINYIDAELTSAFPFGGPPIEGTTIRVQGNDWGIGFTAGLLWSPTSTTRIGLGFRSSIDHKIEGTATMASNGVRISNGPATASIDLPETVTIGLRQMIADRFALLAGIEWTNWSRFDTLTVKSPEGLAPIGGASVTPAHWKDSGFFSLGGEYLLTQNVTMRTGVAYEISGVPTSTRTPRIPDNDRYWVSLGASYTFNHWLSVSAGYSHIFVNDGKVSLEMPTPLYANFKQHIDIVALSARASW